MNDDLEDSLDDDLEDMFDDDDLEEDDLDGDEELAEIINTETGESISIKEKRRLNNHFFNYGRILYLGIFFR